MSRMWQSPNFGPRKLPLDMIVLHYTGMQTARAALERLCDRDAGVSAHYLIDEDGMCHRLVDLQYRAWHAGVSSWEDVRDINSRSIGIELVNPGHEWGYRDFPRAQLDTLLQLLSALTSHHRISRQAIWGHSDIAPLRKEDPGEKFPWHMLARHGFGLWPKPGSFRLRSRDPQSLLHVIGYDVLGGDQLAASMQAFKRHFRPVTLGHGWTQADTQLAQNLAALKSRARFFRWGA